RFISNYSSGKMGVAIAALMARRGAEVTLLKANTTVDIPQIKNLRVVETLSASDMYEAALREFPSSGIAIFAAAVADYTPSVTSDIKIKHNCDNLVLELSPTRDIAACMGAIKRSDQITIGFALETNDEVENARRKLISKNLDAVVLNSLRDAGAGFGTDTNKITIISDRDQLSFALKNKDQVAQDIVEYISSLGSKQ
ncbi:MAG: phosphopantothenoylcysteine decarboxylase, partial [Rikenellaceae bacterium]